MADLAFYLSFVITFMMAIVVYVKSKKQLKDNELPSNPVLKKVIIVMTLGGILSGLFLFPLLVSVFNLIGFPLSYGHGEVLLSALIFNFLLAFVLGLLACVLLSWQPME